MSDLIGICFEDQHTAFAMRAELVEFKKEYLIEATVSQIRTEIDRHFREQGIEIAFPQRDVHIRTITGGMSPAPASGKD